MTKKPANSVDDLTPAERVAARILSYVFVALFVLGFLYFFRAGVQTLF